LAIKFNSFGKVPKEEDIGGKFLCRYDTEDGIKYFVTTYEIPLNSYGNKENYRIFVKSKNQNPMLNYKLTGWVKI